jgi:hypothetical protein
LTPERDRQLGNFRREIRRSAYPQPLEGMIGGSRRATAMGSMTVSSRGKSSNASEDIRAIRVTNWELSGEQLHDRAAGVIARHGHLGKAQRLQELCDQQSRYQVRTLAVRTG